MDNFKTPKRFITEVVAPVCDNDLAITAAFEAVPRALFIDPGLRSKAYEDNALPIGMGQTISQASTVAHMLYLLELKKTDRVLEIGSGSGFVTALLSKLVSEIYAVERLPRLMERSRALLRGLGIRNARFFAGDGREGLRDFAPYDKIIASAGASSLPPELSRELKEGGIMVLPLEGILMKYRKREGKMEGITGKSVRFVDFVGS